MHADKLAEFIAVHVSWNISCITGLEELVCLALLQSGKMTGL